MIAVEQGHEEVVRVILQQSKSDVHQAANDGNTVFSLAKKNNDDIVLKLLLQATLCPRPSGNTPPHSHRPPPTAHRPPPTAHRPPPTAHRPPPTAHRPPPTAGDPQV